jgi:hypothetical protein
MDRRIVSAVTLLVAAFAFHQQQTESAYSATHAAEAGRAVHAPEAPRQPNTATACAIGADCALIPYRKTGPWAASCDRFSSPAQPAHNRAESLPLEGGDPENVGKDHANWCLPEGPGKPGLGFLIVTLPDPVTTHLALYFDRTIETVEAALQRTGFYLDRYWLPWSLPSGTEAPSDNSQDLRVNDILGRFQLSQPGLLIFSCLSDCAVAADTGDPVRVMYVFLVSESPVSGINKTQFRNAVTYEGILSGVPRPAVHVVGPFFSGSAPSAADLAATLKSDAPVFDFASGTMSSGPQGELLRQSGISFHQTVHDDSTAEQFLLWFLRRQRLTGDGRNVAILQEDETRYGNCSLPKSANDCRTRVADNGPFSAVRYITFPRELSRLRNASPDTFGATPAIPGQTAPVSSQGLSWNWKDTSKDEDGVPSFSGQQEPLSQQAVMQSIADTIRHEQIKYVGIIATDIFDILFLSKFLKIAAPNTRLFLLDADLLMVTASSEGRELDGTLAVTTYPLFARNSDWTGSPTNSKSDGFEPSLDIFPSRLAEGVYNAVLLQLNPGIRWGEREYVNPLSTSPSSERPALWLTIVGRTGFWPVDLQDYSETVLAPSMIKPPAALAAGVRERLTFDPPDGTTLFLQGALFAWGAFHLLGMLLGSRTRNPAFNQFGVSANIRERPSAQNYAYYLMCATLALSAMFMLIAVTYARLWWYGHHAWGFDVFYFTFGLIGMALATGACWIARKLPFVAMQSVFPWVLYVGTVLLWLFLTMWPDPVSIFFAQRALYISNGVSPLLPVELLLLMYYVWAWLFLRKVRLSESKQVSVPDPDLLGPGGKGLTQYLTDLKNATDDIVFNRKIAPWIMGGFIISFMLLLRPWAALHSVEGAFYDGLIVFLVLFICLLIVLSWGRYLYLWNRLRRILRGLERTPLRRAFSRFPKSYSWSPLWYEDAGRRAYTISARSLECFQALAKCDPVAATPADVELMTLAFERVVESDDGEAARDEHVERVAALQSIFLRTAEDLLEHRLKDRWALEGGSDTWDTMAKESPTPNLPPTEGKCDLLAEEFVALRYVGLIHYQSAQMKNLVLLLSVGFVLALAAVASYPFLAERECIWSLAGVFVIFGAGIILSFAQMDRDAILSRLSRTDPGKLDLSFYLRVGSYGALPLLALLASQFPSIGRFLFAWVQPTLNALH